MQPSGSSQPAVFLDRDGVVNRALIREHTPNSPKRIEELVILNGVKEAVSILHDHGFVTVVVTNQPDIARGLLSLDLLSSLQKVISIETGLQNFYVCIHDENDDCDCRKPKTGLIKQATKDLNLDISKSFMIGDRWKDIEAGQRVGCKCFFIDNNYREKQPTPPFYTVTSLLEAAIIITEGANAK